MKKKVYLKCSCGENLIYEETNKVKKNNREGIRKNYILKCEKCKKIYDSK